MAFERIFKLTSSINIENAIVEGHVGLFESRTLAIVDIDFRSSAFKVTARYMLRINIDVSKFLPVFCYCRFSSTGGPSIAKA